MKRRRWRRLTMLLVLALAAGAIINVAVAWGCEIWLTQPEFDDSYDGLPRRRADRQWLASHGWNRDNERIVTSEARGFSKSVLWVRDDAATVISDAYQVRVRTGWPLRCFEMHSSAPENAMKAAQITWGYNPMTGVLRVKQGTFWLNEIWALPAKPLWLGLTINTILYAAICWGLFATPAMIRRRWRVRRGLCPACAYPVGSSEVCTECGAAVGKASRDQGIKASRT